MLPGIKLFSFIVLITTGSSNVISQVKAPADLPGSIKTVALYSSDRSFFTDYPIDSVVSNLNSLNTNKKIKFCKRTEDNSKTGLQADYVININLSARKGTYTSATYNTITQPVYYYNSDTSKHSIPTVREEKTNVQTAPGYYAPDQYLIDLTVIVNSKHNKKHRTKITGEEGNTWFNRKLEFSNQIPLIIEMEKYLLDYFSK